MTTLAVFTGFFIIACSSTVSLSFTLEPVLVEKPCDVNADAARLNGVFSNWGVRDDDLIEILTLRTNKQRQAIIAAYQKNNTSILRDDLTRLLSGDYQNFMVGLTYPINEYLASEVNYALVLNDYWGYLEILLTAEVDQIAPIKDAYEKKYNIDLLKDIENRQVSAETRSVLQRVLNPPFREVSPNVNTDLLEKQMTFIPHKSGKCTIEVNGAFFTLVTTQSFEQIGAVVREYDEKNGHGSVYHKFKKYCSDPALRAAYSIITQFAGYREQYYASILDDALGLERKWRYFNRKVTWRAEMDLHLIKKKYHDLTQIGLESRLTDYSAYDEGTEKIDAKYKKALVQFIKGNVPG